MRLNYQLTFQDYQEANQAYFKSQLLLIVGLSALIGLLVFLGIFNLIRRPDNLEGYINLLLGLGFFPFINLLQRYNTARTWKTHPSLREPKILEVTEEGLTLQSSSFKATVKWQVYTGFLETKNLLILYSAKSTFDIFPKRAFIRSGELEKFRGMLLAKQLSCNKC